MSRSDYTALIPVFTTSIGNDAVNAVDARPLHAFLEVGTAFKDWITRRIEEYGFIDGLDFCSFLSESTGGRPSKEYHLTIDTAKELAMVERTNKGKEARQYFIECERLLKESSSIKPMTPLERARQEVAYLEEQERQAAALLVIEAKTAEHARRLDQIETAQDHFTIIGWHRYAKLSGSLPLATAAKLGKQATQFCQEHEIPMGQVPDPRFGTVRTYPLWVLNELFASTVQ